MEGSIKLTFSGADLSNSSLVNADLNGADFSHANINGVSAKRADLGGANLTGANLTGVDFSKADLRAANLSGAILNDAILVGTNLFGAILTQADLSGSSWDASTCDAYARSTCTLGDLVDTGAFLCDTGNIPIIISPKGLSHQNATAFTFDWSDCVGATNYNVVILDPQQIEIDKESTDSSLRYITISAGGLSGLTWTWKVRAYVDGVWGEWSRTRSFLPGRLAAPEIGEPTPVPFPTSLPAPTIPGALTINMTSAQDPVPSGGSTVITVEVLSTPGGPIAGAEVRLSAPGTFEGTFGSSSVSGQTNSAGIFSATWTPPSDGLFRLSAVVFTDAFPNTAAFLTVRAGPLPTFMTITGRAGYLDKEAFQSVFVGVRHSNWLGSNQCGQTLGAQDGSFSIQASSRCFDEGETDESKNLTRQEDSSCHGSWPGRTESWEIPVASPLTSRGILYTSSNRTTYKCTSSIVPGFRSRLFFSP